ncbi:MAG: response regulator [Anaerolineales bacterium]|nr:MAG: response regulator [Chloroflexota bacterium]MBE7434064.1 response regulator [Anaerolineales bacterium]
MIKPFLANKRIFLIEDDLVNIHIFTKVLAKQNAEVLHDTLGHSAVKNIVENLPVDLIVVDVMLNRGQNGFDVFEKIKEEPRTRNIKVIATTSLDPEILIPKAREAGFSGFIGKPVNALELPALLEKVLKGEQVWIGHEL